MRRVTDQMGMRLLRAIAGAMLMAASAPAADPELLSLVPADAQAVAGVNVAQVMQSPLGQYAFGQQENQYAAAVGFQKLMNEAGFDPRRDLREFLLASTVAPNSSAVFVMRGSFDLARISQAAAGHGGKIESYKGFQVIEGISDQGEVVAFVDSTLAILGMPAGVHAAIDCKTAHTQLNPALAAVVKLASASNEAWFAMIRPSSELMADAGAKGNPSWLLGLLKQVQQMYGGVKLGATVVVAVKAVSDTPENATALTDGLKMMAGMGATQNQSGPITAVLRNLQITTDGTAVNLTLTIPELQFEAMLKAGQATQGNPLQHRP